MMKIWYIFILAMLTTLTGCIEDNEVVCDDDKVDINLILSMPASRATTTTDYEAEPFGNDYYIAPEDVEVLVYTTDGVFRDRAIMTSVTATSTYYRYTLSGSLTAFTKSELENNQYKIVVLANINGKFPVYFPNGNYKSLTDGELYSQTVFSYADGTAFTTAILNKDNANGRIPMWGTLTAKLENGVSLTIDMLRAMAKVEVKLSDEIKALGEEIESVKLLQSENSAYLTPLKASTATQTTAIMTNHKSEQNIPTSSQTTVETMFVEHTDGSFYMYLPEQEAYDPATQQNAMMEVKMAGYDKAYPLYFAEYNNEGPVTAFPVHRNHHYKLTITGAPLDHLLPYEVEDWQDVKVTPPTFN